MARTIVMPKPISMTNETSRAFDSEREQLHRQMLSSVSHDLKTPLASIIGALEVFERMKDKLSAEKQAALIAVALQESYRLDNFITNILDMAKFDNGMVKVKREDSEIGSILRDCLMRLEHRLQDSTVNLADSTAVEISTDPVLLSRALCLVLDNAVKYGGASPIIDIDFGRGDANLVFVHIRDNGSGMPEAQMEKIFSKYTRFIKEDQQNAGTGLGLAISRAIMKLLGGTIAVANHPQGGSVFTLSFPAQIR